MNRNAKKSQNQCRVLYCQRFEANLRNFSSTTVPRGAGQGHDAAFSRTSKKIDLYAEEVNAKFWITIIMKVDILVISPDVSLIDFFGFEPLK